MAINDPFGSPPGTNLTASSGWVDLWNPNVGRIDHVAPGRVQTVTAPTGDARYLVARAETLPVDHQAQATHSVANGYTWVFVRGDSSGNCYYAFYGDGFIGIYRLDAGSWVSLVSSTPATPDGAVVLLDATGSTITLLVDGSPVHTVNDPAGHTTQQRAGIGTSDDRGTQLDDFQCTSPQGGSMSRLFIATINVPTGTAARDVVELVAPAASPVRVHELLLTTSVETDATEEQIQLDIVRRTGAFTSGSGGSTVTGFAVNVDGATEDTSTVETGNTTQATGGTAETLSEPFMNNRVGLHLIWTPETRPLIPQTDALIVSQNAAITNTALYGGHIIYEELIA